MKKKFKKIIESGKGFTIVEVLVAIAMFSVILSVAMGSYLRILKNQGFLTAVMAANDNVSLAVEQMARDIRTGTDFCVVDGGGNCVVGTGTGTKGDAVVFRNDKRVCVKYFKKEEGGGVRSLQFASDDTVGNGSCANGVFLKEYMATAEKISVDILEFTLKKESSFDTINVNIKISVSERGMSYENEINTDVSPRKYFGG